MRDSRERGAGDVEGVGDISGQDDGLRGVGRTGEKQVPRFGSE